MPRTREPAAVAAVVVVAIALSACTTDETGPAVAPTDPAAAACLEAERLAEASPWPPPDSGRLEAAIEASDVEELVAALDRARDATTDHERIIGSDHRAVAPSEARDILSVCAALSGRS